jgi:hypothetical protein
MKRMMAAVAAVVAMTACGGSSPTGPSAPPIPSYAGSWSGNYTVTGCNQTGGMALANICGSMGQSAPYRFDFQQSASSVTGSFMLGSVNFPSTGGTIAADGSLALQATSIRDGVTIIVNWALHNSGGPNPAITGTISQAWTSTTLSGQTNIAGTLASAIRGAAAVSSFSADAVTSGPVTPATLGAMAAGKVQQ